MQNIFKSRRPLKPGWSAALSTWLPCLLAVAVICTESTDTFSAGHTSGWLRPIVEGIVGHIQDATWEAFHHYVRKSGHFAGYGTVCLTFLRAWLRSLDGPRSVGAWRFRSTGLAILSTFIVASLDEWHQTFIPSRTGMFSDVVLDTVGGMTACLLVAVVFRWWRR